MLFSKRIKEKEQTIIDLDEEITRLQEKKTDLAIDIAKQQAAYDKMCEKVKATSDFLSLEKQKEAFKISLNNLNDEIKKGEDRLAKLNEETKLKLQDLELCDEYSTLKKLNQEMKESVMLTINEHIKAIKEEWPVKATCLDFFNKSLHDENDVKTFINAQLTKFAIDHCLDPIYYKSIICAYNADWFKELDKLALTLNSNASINLNHPLFQCFVVLA